MAANCSFESKESRSFSPDEDCSFAQTRADRSFQTQADCSFAPKPECSSFEPQAQDCSLAIKSDCSFQPGPDCSFAPETDRSLIRKPDCSFKPKEGCSFIPKTDCSFKPQTDCTFQPKEDCKFDSRSDCSFEPSSECSHEPKSDCSFAPASDCSFAQDAADCSFVEQSPEYVPTNFNRVGYGSRFAAVTRLVESFGLKTSSISTLLYDETYYCPYNSYLFRVNLETPATSSTFPAKQPGTERVPPSGSSTIIVKLIDRNALGVNNKNRVENQVASLHLARQAIVKLGVAPVTIPATYAWGKFGDEPEGEDSWGWLISESRPGVELSKVFSTLQPGVQEQVLEDVAAVLKALQTAQLPAGAKIGGLTFDGDGRIVSGESPMEKREPAATLVEWKQHSVASALRGARESPVIRGWHDNGICARVARFLEESGPEKIMDKVDVHQKVLINAELSTYNMLFDPETERLSAVLDFDVVYVGNPLDEFTIGLEDVGGNISYVGNKLRKAMLTGSFDAPPADLDEESRKQWDLANMWHGAMEKQGCLKPSEVAGYEQILDLDRFLEVLCPFQLGNEGELTRISAEKKRTLRAKAEAGLVDWLERHGY